jgi:hypothetical protein
VHDNFGSGVIWLVFGAAGLLFCGCVAVNQWHASQREPDRRRRNLYGTYLTASQNLHRLPFVAAVFAVMVVLGIWIMARA